MEEFQKNRGSAPASIATPPKQSTGYTPHKNLSDIPLPPRPPRPSNFQSSIRTLNSDVESIKKKGGVSPEAFRLKEEKMKSGFQLPVHSPLPKKEQVSSISLGEAERAKTLTGELPKPPEKKEAPKKMPKISTDIHVPHKKESKKMGVLVIIFVLLIAVGGATWYFFINKRTKIAISPSPTPATSETPDIPPDITAPPSLSDIFKEPVTLTLTSSETTETNMEKTDALLNLAGTEAKAFQGFSTINEDDASISFIQFLDNLGIEYPEPLSTSLNEENWFFFTYGQEEMFQDVNTMVILDNPAIRKGLAVEVTDVEQARSALNIWEDTIDTGFADFFKLPIKSTATETFLTSAYQETTIRYKNFPYPDRTIDYAFVSNGNETYLIVTNSRESIFAFIEALKTKAQ